MLTAGVAVDKATLNFDRLFSYEVPLLFQKEIAVGSIVLVPFGRGDRLRLGIVLSLKEEEAQSKTKQIIDVKTEDTAVTPYSLQLIAHLKETAFCTWYEAVKTVIPYGALYKIEGQKLVPQLIRHTEKAYKIAQNVQTPALKNEKQKSVFAWLANKTATEKEICQALNVTKNVLSTMVKNGVLEVLLQDKKAQAYQHIPLIQDQIILSDAQQQVYQEIQAGKSDKPHLLFGVTSSGKSMVFLKLISQALAKGQGAMLLVPEISLTPQSVRLLKQYFGEVVSVIHSRLSSTERLLQYNLIAQGKAKVVVGTRSAVFAPVQNLKLIIIDEEHEKSFKSESAPRYSAVRVASFISKQLEAKLVLASATPSIESYYLAQNGYYYLHRLTHRYNNMALPRVEVIDMQSQALTGDTGPVSRVILNQLAQNIAHEQQSIILINRRGYSTVGVCSDCKTPLKCEDCSVNLVKHKQAQKLACHYCGKNYPVITTCPICGGEISYIGYGTQHIEEYIQSALPTAKILRMDADTTTQNDAHEEMLEAFGKKEYDILIGTQMVAKGLDFKDVTLVCVLEIDSALNQPSYNANEHAFNLLTQVIGRAGRQQAGSKAIIQTFDVHNPVIQMAQQGDYQQFYEGEIAYRKLNIYPPFCSLCTVAFTHNNEVQAAKDAAAFLQIIKQTVNRFEKQPMVVLGPAPFSVAMVSKMYRWRLTIKCKNTKQFREFLNQTIDIYLKNKENKSSIYVNINPIQD